MESELVSILEELGLTDFQQSLIDLGVECKDDLSYLDVDDLIKVGMRLVQARKLFGAVGLVSPSSRTETESPANPSLPELSRLSSRQRRSNSVFWKGQVQRPKRLIFIRHGQSEANVDRGITAHVPDHVLHLTEEGRQQALDAGRRLKEMLGDETVRFTVSPYVRTRETLNGILNAWGGQQTQMKVKSDCRLREQEYGNYDDPDIKSLHKEKKEFGAFYYRFPNGESAADCYDRASIFFESMYRRWQDNEYKNHVIVSHGMMILVTLMRFLQIEIEDFEQYDSLKNCEFIVLERPEHDPKYDLAFTWAPGEEKQFDGLRMKTSPPVKPEVEIWDGEPGSPVLKSKSYKACA